MWGGGANLGVSDILHLDFSVVRVPLKDDIRYLYVQQQFRLLLDKLQQLGVRLGWGQGGGEGRNWAVHEEAQAASLRQGRAIRRSGFTVLENFKILKLNNCSIIYSISCTLDL